MEINTHNWPIAPGDELTVTVRGRIYEARVDAVTLSGQPHEELHFYINNPLSLKVTVIRERKSC
jgi:hypothetical protein